MKEGQTKSDLRVDAPIFIPQISGGTTEHKVKLKAKRRNRHRKPPSTKSAGPEATVDCSQCNNEKKWQTGASKRRPKRRQNMKKQMLKEEENADTVNSIYTYGEISSLNDVVVPPSQIRGGPQLTGCWAKPLDPSILLPHPPFHSDSTVKLRAGLVLLKKRSALKGETVDYRPSHGKPLDEVPSIYYRRGPNDTTKLMARLWREVELHERRLLEKEVAKKREEETLRTNTNAKSKTNDASSTEKAVTTVDTSADSTRTCLPTVDVVSFASNDSMNHNLALSECIKSFGPSALTQILRENTYSQAEISSAILMTIQMDIPDRLRILCSHLTGTSAAKHKLTKHGTLLDWGNPAYPNPVQYAVANRRDDCLLIMLSTFSSSILTSTKDERGNSALHVCCSQGVTETILLIIKFILSHRNAQANLLRCFSDRNCDRQTPIHCICENGHIDALDAILNHRTTPSNAFLGKVLSLQDSRQQTPLLTAIAAGFEDTVTSLLMWRGNNSTGLLNESVPSALTWAVKAKNYSMVRLLLDFNSANSRSGFDLDEALWQCVAMRENCDADADCMQILSSLILAGASPFVCNVAHEKSAFDLAVSQKDTIYLTSLLNNYDEHIAKLRDERRRDPTLQLRPESFFRERYDVQEFVKVVSLRSALTRSLFQCWNATSDDDADSRATCAVALFNHGAIPDEASLEILKRSMINDSPISQQHLCSVLKSKVFSASYKRLKMVGRNTSEKSEGLTFWSRELACLPWLNRINNRCSWLSSAMDSKSVAITDVVLVSHSNRRYDTHSAILQTCGKLASALHFAFVSRLRKDDSKIEIKVGLADEHLVLLLEHLYHGSMLSITTHHQGQFFSKLVDMLSVAEEYSCSSLFQECEMRLLANIDSFNQCFCCSCLAKPKNYGDSSNQFFECIYEVSGPSALISSENVVDVLSLISQVLDSPKIVEYRIFLTEDVRDDKKRERMPFQELQEQTLVYIFYNFKSVISSPTWKHHVAENNGENVEQAFLRLCLDDLSACMLPSLDTDHQMTSKLDRKENC